jgi:D-alanyl-D-alanine carboxypeptidase (penicillin-binding protein 5/6)
VLIAPIAADHEYGELVVSLAGEERLRLPLVALQAVEEGGIFKRLWDSIVLFFVNLIS